MDIRYELHKLKENLIHKFWGKMPNRILYWAVINAWARATCTKYSNKHPDEVTWSMMCNYLEEK